MVTISTAKAADLEVEKRRLEEAKAKSMDQLNALAEKAREKAGEESALLFETHAMFVEDEDFVDCINTALDEEHCTAERAVKIAGEQFAAMLAAIDDPYMQARAADIKDVARRIQNNLMGVIEGGIDSDEPVILAADDLAPSETLQLDKSRILGFITQGGSGNSHTAILARTMGIPAICGLGDSLKEELNGRTAYIDGETGSVAIEPDEITLTAFQTKLEKQLEMKHLLETMKGQEDVTLDGRHMMVYCNIGSPKDVAAVLSNDGQGIGLFRSEFLYLAAGDYPTEEEQFRAYKKVAAAMGGRRVVIRTLDIGADKQVGYFQLHKEENPALGVRAIRICLNRPEVFRTQLRALYRASAHGKVAIMFPMITSVWEIRECKRACQEVMAELDKELQLARCRRDLAVRRLRAVLVLLPGNPERPSLPMRRVDPTRTGGPRQGVLRDPHIDALQIVCKSYCTRRSLMRIKATELAQRAEIKPGESIDEEMFPGEITDCSTCKSYDQNGGQCSGWTRTDACQGIDPIVK